MSSLALSDGTKNTVVIDFNDVPHEPVMLDLNDEDGDGTGRVISAPEDKSGLGVPESRYKGKNCTSAGPYNTEEDLMKVLSIRMEHDFQATEQLAWPSTNHLGNTELLDHSFDIMIATCPVEVVQTEYLQLIREFAVIRLDEEWKEGWNVINQFEPDLLTILRDMASNCSEILREKNEHKWDGKFLNSLYTNVNLNFQEYLRLSTVSINGWVLQYF